MAATISPSVKENNEIIKIIIDAQISRGLDYKAVIDYSACKDSLWDGVVIFSLPDPAEHPKRAKMVYNLIGIVERLGFNVEVTTKDDVDPRLNELIERALNQKQPLTELILGTGDRDHSYMIKKILRLKTIKVTIVVGDGLYLASQYNKIAQQNGGLKIFSFPRKRRALPMKICS